MIGQAADFFQRLGMPRQDGDAKNNGAVDCGKRDGRKFAEASKELSRWDSSSEMNLAAPASREIDARSRPWRASTGSWPAASIDDEPRSRRREIHAARLEKGRRCPHQYLQHLWIEAESLQASGGSQRRGKELESDDEHAPALGEREGTKIQARDDSASVPSEPMRKLVQVVAGDVFHHAPAAFGSDSFAGHKLDPSKQSRAAP